MKIIILFPSVEASRRAEEFDNHQQAERLPDERKEPQIPRTMLDNSNKNLYTGNKHTPERHGKEIHEKGGLIHPLLTQYRNYSRLSIRPAD